MLMFAALHEFWMGRQKTKYAPWVRYCSAPAGALFVPYATLIVPLLYTAISCYGNAGENTSPICDSGMTYNKPLRDICSHCGNLTTLLEWYAKFRSNDGSYHLQELSQALAGYPGMENALGLSVLWIEIWFMIGVMIQWPGKQAQETGEGLNDLEGGYTDTPTETALADEKASMVLIDLDK